ncbi:uncharacterized protein EV154DRAFT_538349 [Mucor mucedo]|uniref:uncharacterized protein n=1 Tax=Mucor mucedo TaxID=29922 RepID=UPI00221F99D7|nr:uncharacterized protein EV154DRAFT_538349 [Mucor mucedo]KAI7890473.1 hypothetical protein EV154DRAFT_538349 [Mucor mucedo]
MLTIDSPPPPPPPLRPVNTTTPTTAASSGSLYHICRSVLDKLSTVEGMANYLDCDTTDPLTKLTLICRQGFPLCTLYNALNPVTLLNVESDPNLNAINSCKAYVYHFIVACRKDLLFPEEDMFTISDLYQNDTNGFVKVVNTINKLLQLLENRGIITVRSTNRNSDPNAPKNTRDKVVLELLETERKYVQDMETLQNYMRELQIQKVVSPDTIHYLFGNLNALVDFQRRFLIQLEEIAEKSPQEQRIGLLFLQMEESFSVYEPYCANYFPAQDLVVQETPRLQKLGHILDPSYQLPSLLIKPVQRICKYPLLLKEILKSTDKDWQYYGEAQDSVDAIKRVTEKVNETQRQHENVQAVQDLKKRLDETKEATIDAYGSLLLQDKLFVNTNAMDERELHVFFFEQALLFCKESKGSNLLQKSNTLSINKKKRRGSLVPKFFSQISKMTDLTTRCRNGTWCLTIDLKDDTMTEVCMKFRNEEQMKMWLNTLTKSIHKATDSEIMQLSTPFNELLDDEDDDEFYDDEEDDEFAPTLVSNRSRSSSFNNHHQQPMIRSIQQDIKYNNGRPHHNVPGMNLSPLPRSNSSLTTSNLSTSPPSAMNYSYYPASPPPSHPSSPTSSSRISSTSTSSTTWHSNSNTLIDVASSFMTNECSDDYNQHYVHSLLSSTGRSQSQNVAMETSRTRTALSVNQNRSRSQSSPNIMKNNVPIVMTPSESLPQVPNRNHKPTPLDLSRQESKHYVRNVASTPRLTDIALTHGAPPSPGTIKIKLNYNDGIYVIVTNNEVTFFELMEKVDKKIRLVGNLKQNDLLRLKYQDEDCDFITISSNDDVQMAFESRGDNNTVNLFVNL